MPARIRLYGQANNNQRIDYLKMVLERDSKRLEIIDSHRNKNLAHALIAFAAAYGASIKLLSDANPVLVSVSLLFLAVCFFLRDCQLHRYEHGWKGTIRMHSKKLACIINHPVREVGFRSYYRRWEKEASRPKEWMSFNRWVYYLLIIGSISAGIIIYKGWAQPASS